VKVLLDTHALLWWWHGNPRLSQAARNILADPANEVYVSAATAWEVATKVRIGKLAEARILASRLGDVIVEQGFLHLPISVEHGLRAGLLTSRHRDPFDRIIAAQAIINDLEVISTDPSISELGARTLW